MSSHNSPSAYNQLLLNNWLLQLQLLAFQERLHIPQVLVERRILNEDGAYLAHLLVNLSRDGGESVGNIQTVNGLGKGDILDGDHLPSIVDDRTGEQRRVGAHTHNILVVIVVRDAMHIVGHGQRLALGGGGGSRELARLHAVVEP